MIKPGPWPTGGLDPHLARRLERRAAGAAERPVETLLDEARSHLAEVRRAAKNNPFLNVRLAEALCDRLHAVATHWQRMPAEARPWLKGAIAYFAATLDDVPDLESPIGFDDDCEVLNACLALAGRPDLQLDPAVYDEL